jgi:hypothetical protein
MMARLRATVPAGVALLLSFNLVMMPLPANSAVGLGTVVSASAQHAFVDTAAASVGTTVFTGDKLSTDTQGNLQVRAGAARLLLMASSRATWSEQSGSPGVTLTSGTAAFSTANAKAFSLRAGTAVFRPRGDEPTVGNITVLNAKELVVRCSRGALTIEVEDDIRVIPEGMAYHVVLDPNAPPPADPAARAAWGQNQPIKAGKSKFIWYAIAFTALVTWFTLSEALESPDRP